MAGLPARPKIDDPFGAVCAALTAGGDDRIHTDPATGRNSYGVPASPKPDEIWFASSTASAIGARGFTSAGQTLQALAPDGIWRRDGIAALCDDVRGRIKALFGTPDTAVVLSASGTDAELIALTLIERLGGRPVSNIVIAAEESGTGVFKASGGTHFRAQTCLGAAVTPGARIAGLEDADIETIDVPIRGTDGACRTAADIDLDVLALSEDALARGRQVLLHVLDTAKTGLVSQSRKTAALLMAAAPGRVHVVVDACQLRCTAAQVRDDLARGFIVIVTGSKFAAGPPFSGALLLPAQIAEALVHAPTPPTGLRDYSTALDWPDALQMSFARNLRDGNIGPALRWTAALAELEALAHVAPERQQEIVAAFEAAVLERARETRFAAPLDADHTTAVRVSSLVPLMACDRRGATLLPPAAKAVHVALRARVSLGSGTRERAVLRRIVNLGQPVAVGAGAALRISIDAPRITAIADGIAAGGSLETAMDATRRDLDDVFAKWAAVLDTTT